MLPLLITEHYWCKEINYYIHTSIELLKTRQISLFAATAKSPCYRLKNCTESWTSAQSQLLVWCHVHLKFDSKFLSPTAWHHPADGDEYYLQLTLQLALHQELNTGQSFSCQTFPWAKASFGNFSSIYPKSKQKPHHPNRLQMQNWPARDRTARRRTVGRRNYKP
jgi:hypothetical protein